MAESRRSADDWDTCPGCGERLEQPESGRFDEDGAPVTTPAWHPECAQKHMRQRLERQPGGIVRMYDSPDVGPLSD